MTASAIVYVLTYALVGIAGDFRYGYWCVLASITGGAVALTIRKAGKAATIA